MFVMEIGDSKFVEFKYLSEVPYTCIVSQRLELM